MNEGAYFPDCNVFSIILLCVCYDHANRGLSWSLRFHHASNYTPKCILKSVGHGQTRGIIYLITQTSDSLLRLDVLTTPSSTNIS